MLEVEEKKYGHSCGDVQSQSADDFWEKKEAYLKKFRKDKEELIRKINAEKSLYDKLFSLFSA